MDLALFLGGFSGSKEVDVTYLCASSVDIGRNRNSLCKVLVQKHNGAFLREEKAMRRKARDFLFSHWV
jgi:hypothetical protein